MTKTQLQQRDATREPGVSGTGVALARAADILSALEAARRPLSLADLASQSGVPRATLLGILNTLVAHDFLVQESATGLYRLGYAWLRFAEIRRGQSHIRESALPVMRQIRDAVDETVILSLKIGDRRVHLDAIESTQPVRRIAHPGRDGPLHVGAAGLVLLAGLSEDALDSYLARTHGIDEAARSDIRDALARIRRDGCAIVSGTVNPETAAVAAPIKTYSGESIASLTISCPRDRFTERLEASCIELVSNGALLLSRSLGHAR